MKVLALGTARESQDWRESAPYFRLFSTTEDRYEDDFIKITAQSPSQPVCGRPGTAAWHPIHVHVLPTLTYRPSSAASGQDDNRALISLGSRESNSFGVIGSHSGIRRKAAELFWYQIQDSCLISLS